jgi:hypothetical protein
MKISKNVDLGASFQRLKDGLNESTAKTKGSDPESYAVAFGHLSMTVKKHLLECTDITGDQIYKSKKADPDDLKGINI